MFRIRLQWLAPIVLLVLAFILLEKSPKGLIAVAPAQPGDFPYAYMTDIETLEYDAEGKLVYKLETPAAKYFQRDANQPGAEDYTLIEQPRIIFYAANNATPWHMSAAEGFSDANGYEVRLKTDVVAEQKSSAQGPIEVTTSELRINTLLQYAETDKAVKMRAQQNQIETVGMRAFLNEDRIELLSEVRGVYAP